MISVMTPYRAIFGAATTVVVLVIGGALIAIVDAGAVTTAWMVAGTFGLVTIGLIGFLATRSRRAEEREATRGEIPQPTSPDAYAPESALGAAWFAGIALLVYGLALPLLSVTGSTDKPAALILLCVSTYSGVRIARELLLGARRWLVLTFHTFCFVFLGVAPLMQLGAGTLHWAAPATDNVLAQAAFLCLAGILAFDAGVGIVSSRWGQLRAMTTANRPRHPEALISDRALLVLGIASAASIALFVNMGGMSVVLASRAEMQATLCRSSDLANCGIVSAVVRVPPALLAIAALGASNLGRRPIRWLALLIGLVGLFMTANPVSTARFWFGAVGIGLLGIVIARHAVRRAVFWTLLPAALLLVFPVLDVGRYAGWTPNIDLDPSAIVEKQDFDAFQQVVNGIVYTQTYGHRNGAQLESAVFFFVPRGIWEDKALPTGTLVAGSLGFANTNVSAPLWEEGYVDFGPTGVIALLLVLGMVVGVVEVASGALRSSRAAPFVFIPLVAGYGIFLLRGSLLPVIGTLAVIMVLVFITWWLSRMSPDSVAHHRSASIATRARS